jgi:LytS/YehU family sensor histidine kinase
MAGLRGGLTVAGFAGTIKLAKYWYQQHQLNQQLEKEKLKAELQLLKAQVHPHFLFNTLNNLYALTLTNSAQAPEVVLKLSGLLRYMLYECNVPHVSLVRELQLMSDYLQLEKLRYGDRLDLSVNISGDPAGKLMAPLLLIPFLENSFKHGASEHLDQAWISVDILVRDNTLKFKVINAIPAAESPQVLTGGLGLVNVRKRLQLLYPGTHELKTIREGETFLVSLTLQLAEEQNQTTSRQPAPVQPYDLPLEQPS